MPRKTEGPRYLEVTDRIVEALKNGVVPWERPWASSAPRNAESGRRYRGINRLLLELTALERGYESSGWLTYSAAKRLGGHVRRGESGTMVIFYERRPKRPSEEPSWDQECDQEFVYLARHHWVFSLHQVEGLDGLREHFARISFVADPDGRAEQILQRCGARIVHAGDRAVYAPEEDCIYLPPRAQFTSAPGYYSTAFHEVAHWTGHPSRLHRNFEGRFGDPEYAAEELIAEMASAFLCTDAGLETVSQSASYIESWLRLLDGDCRAVFTAAKEAQLAADFILGEWEPDVRPATELGVEEASRRQELVTLG